MCMDFHNLAAWSEEPKGDLQIKEAPIPSLADDEILIEVSIPFHSLNPTYVHDHADSR